MNTMFTIVYDKENGHQQDNSWYFYSPQLILQKSNGQFQRNVSFFKVPEGVQHFPEGVQLFPGGGGVQLLIPYRNPYNL